MMVQRNQGICDKISISDRILELTNYDSMWRVRKRGKERERKREREEERA